jgi:molybdopterin biosynthesis enzyme MoaB
MTENFTVGVLTISDKGSQGIRTDESGPMAVSILEKEGFTVVRQ